MMAFASEPDAPAHPPAVPGGAWPWSEPSPWGGGPDFTHWQRWMQGLDVGVGYLGHFSSVSTLTAPEGSFFFEGRYHLWYEHLIAPYLVFGASADKMDMAGTGVMINLVEFLQNPSDPLAAGGGHRGLFGPLVQNFMIYASAEFVRYFFPPPNPALGQKWGSGSYSLQPSVGAQWYFTFDNPIGQRFYVEISGTAAIVNGNKFLYPALRFGVEFK